jgi:hypothetical protein
MKKNENSLTIVLFAGSPKIPSITLGRTREVVGEAKAAR